YANHECNIRQSHGCRRGWLVYVPVHQQQEESWRTRRTPTTNATFANHTAIGEGGWCTSLVPAAGGMSECCHNGSSMWQRGLPHIRKQL
ncbi:MAG: hypothetical protein ABIK83_04645, partial [Candidatus Zixiibacteriota bacterium]